MTSSPSTIHLLDPHSHKESDIIDDNDGLSEAIHRQANANRHPAVEFPPTVSKGVTGPLLLAVLAAISGTSFHFGYASGVMNSPQGVIQDFINETNIHRNPSNPMSESTITLIFSLAVSVFALGGMIGGVSGGLITERFGRKGGMFLNNIVSAIACIMMFISKPVHSYEILIIGRFFIGFACGYGSSVAPTYINEVSPRHLRGTLGVSFQLGVVVILFFSQVISLRSVLGDADHWHYALGLPIIFSLMQIILLFLVCESPKHLLSKKNDVVGAEKALRWLRGNSYTHNELIEMQTEQSQQQSSARMIDLFRLPTIRWALVITIMLQLSQQLSGINAVIYYSTEIFKTAGFDEEKAQFANLGLGGANIIVTIVSVFLMDRLGRRLLHLVGLGGMCVASIILVISLVVKATTFWNTISLIVTILFVAFFGIGPGSIPWLITAELFNQAYRVPASSIAVLVNWSANFLVGLTFKPLYTDGLKKYTFLLFTGLLVFFFIFTFLFIPETKAKTVDTIYAELNAGQVWRKPRRYNRMAENDGNTIRNNASSSPVLSENVTP